MDNEEVRNAVQELTEELRKFREIIGAREEGISSYTNSVKDSAKEIRNHTEHLKNLSREEELYKKMLSGGVDSLKATFRELANSTEELTESEKKQQREINKAIKAFIDGEKISREMRAALKIELEYRVKNTEGYKHLAKELDEVNYNFERFSKITERTTSVFVPFREALLSAEKSLSKYGSTIQALSSVTKSIIDETFGQKNKWAKSLKIATDALVGLELKALKYGDALLKNKDSLAEIGVIGKNTSEDLLSLAKKAQYTSATLEGWTKATKSLGTSISILGQNVNENMETWADLSTYSVKQLDNYRAMGYEQDQVIQSTADYVQLLRQQGTLVTQNMIRDGKLRAGADEYLKTLVDLTQVTNKSREEAKKSLEIAANQREFNVKINLMNQERVRLEKIANDTSKSANERAIARERADKLRKQEESQRVIMTGAAEAGGEELASQVAKFFATGGLITSADQALQFGPELIKLMRDAMRGERVDRGRFEQLIGERYNENMRRYGSTAIAANEQLGKMLGTNNKTMEKLGDTVIKNAEMGTTQQQKYAESRRLTDAAVAGKTPAATEDDAENIRKAMRNLERKTQETFDNMARDMLKKNAEMADVFISKLTTIAELAEKTTQVVSAFGALISVIGGLTFAAGAAAAALRSIAILRPGGGLPPTGGRGGGGGAPTGGGGRAPTPVPTAPAPSRTTPTPVPTAPVPTAPAPSRTTPAPVPTAPVPVATRPPTPVPTAPVPTAPVPVATRTTPTPVPTTPAPTTTRPIPALPQTSSLPSGPTSPVPTAPVPVATRPTPAPVPAATRPIPALPQTSSLPPGPSSPVVRPQSPFVRNPVLAFGTAAAASVGMQYGASKLSNEGTSKTDILSELASDTLYGASYGLMFGPKGAAVGAGLGLLHGITKLPSKLSPAASEKEPMNDVISSLDNNPELRDKIIKTFIDKQKELKFENRKNKENKDNTQIAQEAAVFAKSKHAKELAALGIKVTMPPISTKKGAPSFNANVTPSNEYLLQIEKIINNKESGLLGAKSEPIMDSTDPEMIKAKIKSFEENRQITINALHKHYAENYSNNLPNNIRSITKTQNYLDRLKSDQAFINRGYKQLESITNNKIEQPKLDGYGKLISAGKETKISKADQNNTISELLRFTPQSGSKQNFDRLDENVQSDFLAMITEYGKPVQINSSFRDIDKQRELYNNYITGKSRYPVAVPGQSKHNYGKAIDLDPSVVASLNAKGLLEKYGFNRIANDPVHIEKARTGGTFNGPSSGYLVELHGRETIVPTPDPNTKLSLNDTTKEPSSVMNTKETVTNSNTINTSNDRLVQAISDMTKKLDSIDSRIAVLNTTSERTYHAMI